MSTESLSPLPVIEAAGSPFALGYALGRFGAAAVHQRLLGSRAWSSVMAWKGSKAATGLADRTAAGFPRCWQEIEGLAEGLELPFEEVFLWNCRGDLWAMAPDGCTTVQIPGATTRWIAHNEDGDPQLSGTCAMARLAPEGALDFTSFVYPGSLPGHSFAVNRRGLVQTVNNIRSLRIGPGVPRMVLARALLESPTLDEAVKLVRRTPTAGGFHLSLAQAGDPRLLSVEFASGRCSLREVAAVTAHANHLVHAEMADLPQIVTRSSADRQARGDELCADPAGEEGGFARRLLGDKAAARLPIHRTDPADPDGEITLATAVFRIGAQGVVCAVHLDPLAGPELEFELELQPDFARGTVAPA